jgi:hypothetical protein
MLDKFLQLFIQDQMQLILVFAPDQKMVNIFYHVVDEATVMQLIY